MYFDDTHFLRPIKKDKTVKFLDKCHFTTSSLLLSYRILILPENNFANILSNFNLMYDSSDVKW